MLLYNFRDFIRYYDRTFLLLNKDVCYIEHKEDDRERMYVVDISTGAITTKMYQDVNRHARRFSMPSRYVNVGDSVIGIWRTHNNRSDGMYLRSDGPSHFFSRCLGVDLSTYYNHILKRYCSTRVDFVTRFAGSAMRPSPNRYNAAQVAEIASIWDSVINPNHLFYKDAYKLLINNDKIAVAVSDTIALAISIKSSTPVVYHRDMIVGVMPSDEELIISDPSLTEEIEQALPAIKINVDISSVKKRRGKVSMSASDFVTISL